MSTTPGKPPAAKKPVMSDQAVRVAQWTLSLAGLALLAFVLALIVFSPNTEASSTTRDFVQELVETTAVGPGASPAGTVTTTTTGPPTVTTSSTGKTSGIDASKPTKQTEVDAEVARSDVLIGGLAALGAALLVLGLVLPGIQSFKTASFEFVMRGPVDVTPEEKETMQGAVVEVAQRSHLDSAQTAQLAFAAEERLRLQKMASFVYHHLDDAPDSWAAIRDYPPPELDEADIQATVWRAAFDIGLIEKPP